MKILLVGNSARAHIIAEKLSESRHEPEIFAFMSARNPGIVKIAADYALGKLDDVSAIVAFAKKVGPDFAFISPELPLSVGVVDALLDVGVPSVGPIKELAALESSKSFVRELMAEYGIVGGPRFVSFSTMEGVAGFIDELSDTGYVLKPDGLTGGKGVKVSGEHFKSKDEALAYCREVIGSHGRIVIEEKFVGEEFSLMSFVDGKTVVDLPPVQDHKRAYEGDTGSNTGGMGSYSGSRGLPFVTSKDLSDAHAITVAVNDAMYKKYGRYYKGVMYGGFMATRDGVRLIEYNARLGDPEAMNVLSVLRTDLVDISLAIINGTLSMLPVSFDKLATVCKYIVPDGYPDNPRSGDTVDVSGVSVGAKIYFASVDEDDDKLVMGKSRALAIVGIADTLDEAEKIAEEGCRQVRGAVRHRTDIGTRELVKKRIDHMRMIRG
ncbi:MAG: phosphoribosylamine--glycine ligase [archaeon]